MKAIKITYWTTTILVAAMFIFSGGMATFTGDAYADQVVELGYPRYLPTVHGPLKLAAAIILLIPRSFVFKHWAYAGVVMTLLFAALAHAAKPEPYFIHIIMLVLASISYYLYVKKMSLKAL